MKNRTYLLIAFILFVVIGVFFAVPYSPKDASIGIYWDAISLLIILFPLISFYVIAFPDINQVSSLYINKYKMRWLSELAILLGTYATFLGFLSMWTDLAISPINNENGQSDLNLLGTSLAIAFITMIYALVLSFSYYVISFFLSENDFKPKEIGNRYISIIIAWLNIIFVYGFTFWILFEIVQIPIMQMIGFNEYTTYMLFLGIAIFFHLQNNSSITNLIINLFNNSKESINEISSQIKAIQNVKRFISGLMMIAVLFFSTALFFNLTYYIDDVNAVFSLLVPGTQIILWCYVIIILLYVLEGKYNYKLYLEQGTLDHDNMFLAKYVALPTILYLIMIIILFVLFNVLF